MKMANAAVSPTFTKTIGTLKYDTDNGRSVTIPEDTAPGTYTLQWVWSGWYACVDVTVSEKLQEGATLGKGTTYILGDAGTYDSKTGVYTCNKGYKEKTKDGVKGCFKSSGLSAGAGFGIFVLVLALVVLGIAGGLFALYKLKPVRRTRVLLRTPATTTAGRGKGVLGLGDTDVLSGLEDTGGS